MTLRAIAITVATFGTAAAIWIFAIWVASVLEGLTALSRLGQWF